MQVVNETEYLFLPASADLSKLHLNFTLREDVKDAITLTGTAGSITVNGLSGEVDLTKVTGNANGRIMISIGDLTPMPLYVMHSNNVSALYITSDDPSNHGRSFVDASKSNKATAKMKLVSESGSVIYDDKLSQIKARGNTTFVNAEKKSYQIKLNKKTDLIDCGENIKTWVLLAGYFDATQLHDKTYKDLANAIGMSYVPNSDWVDLYYDGEYRGIYLVGEKNSINSTGIDIKDMEANYSKLNENYGTNANTAKAENRFGTIYQYTKDLTEPENITGGYLLELNMPGYDEASGFNTKQGASLNVKSPEWCGQKSMEYISEYYQEFEDAIYATDENGVHTGYNAETGKYYYEYCDLTSLVQMYLIEELSNNVDGFYSSFYFYKDADSIMYAGPVWDMESTSGTGWSGRINADLEFINGRYLAKSLVQIPGFMDAVKDYYNKTFRSKAIELIGNNGIIAKNAQSISQSTEMNYVLWPYIKVGNPHSSGHEWADGTTYNTVVSDMISWLETRISVLDKAYASGSTDPTDPTEPSIPVDPTEPTMPTVPPAPTIPVDPTEPGVDTKCKYTVQADYYTNGIKDNNDPVELVNATADIGSVVTVTQDDAWKTYNGRQYVLSTANMELKITAEAENNILTLRYDRSTGSSGGSSGSGSSTAASKYKLSFNTNGGSSIDAVSAEKGTVLNLNTYVPVKNGYDFAGWYLDSSLTTKAASIKLDKDTTVYANWKETAGASELPFTDVLKGSYYHDAVLWAVKNNVTSGTSADKFDPDRSCTRAQIVTFLWRSAGCPEPTITENPFSDVSSEAYYYKAVLWAVENGIAKGKTATTFAPDDTVTRGQTVTFINRASNDSIAVGENSFKDVNNDSYYYEAVLWAVKKGITKGVSDNIFAPDSACTRGQIVTFLYRLAEQ